MNRLTNSTTITSSVATRHYGVAAKETYNISEDYGETTYTDKHDGVTQVQKMTWYIRKVIRHPLSRVNLSSLTKHYYIKGRRPPPQQNNQIPLPQKTRRKL